MTGESKEDNRDTGQIQGAARADRPPAEQQRAHIAREHEVHIHVHVHTHAAHAHVVVHAHVHDSFASLSLERGGPQVVCAPVHEVHAVRGAQKNVYAKTENCFLHSSSQKYLKTYGKALVQFRGIIPYVPGSGRLSVRLGILSCRPVRQNCRHQSNNGCNPFQFAPFIL